MLAPGTYTASPGGYIDFPPVLVTLLSQAGPDVTTVLGLDLNVASVGADGSLIEGINFTGAPQYVLLCNYRSITVRGCVFSGNVNFRGFWLISSSTVVENCVFRGNGTNASWIACDGGGSAVIRNCVFVDNLSGGGGIVAANNSSPSILNNTFVGNTITGPPPNPGYAVLIFNLSSSPFVANNIVAFTVGGQAVRSVNGATPLYSCNNFFGNASGDGPYGTNFSADPLFCADYPFEEVSIKASSPCAPQNSPCGILIGAAPVGCAECPTDRNMEPGARQRFAFSLYNNTGTAEQGFYIIQGDASLAFTLESELGGYAPFLFGARSVDAHSSLKLFAWAQVAENAVPEDSLSFHVVSGLIGGQESPDTCVVTVHVGSTPVGIAKSPPLSAALKGSIPNPFSSTTRLQYAVPDGAGQVSLSIYDAAGRHVRTLVARVLPEGEYMAEWNGTDGANRRVPSGVYFGLLRGKGFTATRKLVLLR